MDFVLDEKDRRILGILKEDARRSFTDIGRELGLSEGAVRKRIKSLLKKGAIRRFTVETNEALYPVRSIVMIKLNAKAHVDDVINALKRIHGVFVAHPVTGGYDIFTEVFSENTNQLHDKITSIRDVKGVGSTLTMTILD